jgi:hypothetical protein
MIKASVTQGAKAATAVAAVAGRLIREESPERPGGDRDTYAQRRTESYGMPAFSGRPARWVTVARWREKANNPSPQSPRPRRRRSALARIRGSHAVIFSPGVLRPLGGLPDQHLDITAPVRLTSERSWRAGGGRPPTGMGPALLGGAPGFKSPSLHPVQRIAFTAKRQTIPATRPLTAMSACVCVSCRSER